MSAQVTASNQFLKPTHFHSKGLKTTKRRYGRQAALSLTFYALLEKSRAHTPTYGAFILALGCVPRSSMNRLAAACQTCLYMLSLRPRELRLRHSASPPSCTVDKLKHHRKTRTCAADIGLILTLAGQLLTPFS